MFFSIDPRGTTFAQQIHVQLANGNTNKGAHHLFNRTTRHKVLLSSQSLPWSLLSEQICNHELQFFLFLRLVPFSALIS
jgi:hypothetical protein